MEKRFCGQCGNRHEPEDRFCRYCGCFLGAGASDKRTSSIYAPPKIAKSEALKITETDQIAAQKEAMKNQDIRQEQDELPGDKKFLIEQEYQPISPDAQRIQKTINSAMTLFALSKMF